MHQRQRLEGDPNRRTDRGASAIQTVGIVVLSALLIGGMLAVVSQGRVAATAAYAFCTVTGGSCADPRLPAGLHDLTSCRVPPGGPTGATRLAINVDLGAGAAVTVEESAGGAFTVTVPGAGSAAPGVLAGGVAGPLGTASKARIFTAASEAELAGILSGVQRQNRQNAWFGSGGNIAADAWSASGAFLFDIAGEPGIPAPSGTFQSAGANLMPSAHAYELAAAVGWQGGAVSVGTTTWQGGGTTELFVGGANGLGGGALPVAIEVDRDAGGFINAVRTTTQSASGTEINSLPVTSSTSAADVESVLVGLGVSTQRRYSHPPARTVSAHTDALGAFREAATRSGYVSRATGFPILHSGNAVPLDKLGETMNEAHKAIPKAQHWDGSSWEPWTGCQ